MIRYKTCNDLQVFFMFQQLNSLKPQKIIIPPRMISHSLEGSRKAQIVQIPMISRISPNSSTSPGLRQHIFLNFIKITSYYELSIKNANIRTRAIKTMYHTKTGTVCITITAPAIAIMKPMSFKTNLLSLNAYHP